MRSARHFLHNIKQSRQDQNTWILSRLEEKYIENYFVSSNKNAASVLKHKLISM